MMILIDCSIDYWLLIIVDDVYCNDLQYATRVLSWWRSKLNSFSALGLELST